MISESVKHREQLMISILEIILTLWDIYLYRDALGITFIFINWRFEKYFYIIFQLFVCVWYFFVLLFSDDLLALVKRRKLFLLLSISNEIYSQRCVL